MTRQALAAYLADTYSAEGEHLFAKYPSFLVFRHNGSRKWFAVIMDIPRKNLDLTGEGEISVVKLAILVAEKPWRELHGKAKYNGSDSGQTY